MGRTATPDGFVWLAVLLTFLFIPSSQEYWYRPQQLQEPKATMREDNKVWGLAAATVCVGGALLYMVSARRKKVSVRYRSKGKATTEHAIHAPDEMHAHPQARTGEVVGHVQSIHVYPVKSCRGIQLESSPVEARGLLLDRLWMVVTASGTFRTQRQLPKMTLIQPNLPSSLSTPLELRAPDMPACVVPVSTAGTLTKVRVWDDWCMAYDQGDEAAKWLSTFLGEEGLRLVRIDEKERRQVDPKFAPRGQTTGFADGFPFLLANQASLDDLNARLAQPIPMERFRPNIVMRGPAPFAEDHWDRITVGDLALRVVKPCSRCKIPNTDQQTAKVGQEPATTLKTFRTGGILGIDVGGKDEFYFATNLIHDSRKKTGVLSVMDPVMVFS